jgi:hypothetical protein
MNTEDKYFLVKQGGYSVVDNDKYIEGGRVDTLDDMLEFVRHGIAKEVDILEFFETKARWGTGYYGYINGKFITGSCQWDSSG